MLFGVSCVSGWYQLQFLKFTELLWGPFHENFSLNLALVLFGIALSNIIVKKFKISFNKLLLLSSFSILFSLFAFLFLIYTGGNLNDSYLIDGLSRTILKFIMMIVMGGVSFTCFGSSIPVLIKEMKSSSGMLLGISACGNCLGFLISVFLVDTHTSYFTAAMGASLILIAFLAHPLRKQRTLYLSWLFVSIFGYGALSIFWNPQIFAFSYEELGSQKRLSIAKEQNQEYTTYKKFNNLVSILRQKNDSLYIVINGYRSFFTNQSLTNPYELVFGMTPVLYAKATESALVLGLGSGITAGAVSTLFQKTTVVEINPILIDLQPQFREHNIAVYENPKVKIINEDGLSFLLQTKDNYDVIVNTVTTPIYFSSSKLYTEEFFLLAKSRLKKGGIYTLYFDSRVYEEGAKIIFQTLRKSFHDCQVAELRQNYSQVFCSDEKLSPRAVSDSLWSPKLAEKFEFLGAIDTKKKIKISQLLEAIVFPKTNIMEDSKSHSVNTFDKPILEYIMASRSPFDVDRLNWVPYKLLNVDYRVSISNAQLGPLELSQRCQLIARFSGRDFNCEEQLRQEADPLLWKKYSHEMNL